MSVWNIPWAKTWLRFEGKAYFTLQQHLAGTAGRWQQVEECSMRQGGIMWWIAMLSHRTQALFTGIVMSHSSGTSHSGGTSHTAFWYNPMPFVHRHKENKIKPSIKQEKSFFQQGGAAGCSYEVVFPELSLELKSDSLVLCRWWCS